MKLKGSEKKRDKSALVTARNEQAMIEGIMEGSPDGVGVAVVRLVCGCRKMAAVDRNGEPASKVIIYRDQAESVCDLCKQDNGAVARVRESFIHWVDQNLDDNLRKKIEAKVFGTASVH